MNWLFKAEIETLSQNLTDRELILNIRIMATGKQRYIWKKIRISTGFEKMVYGQIVPASKGVYSLQLMYTEDKCSVGSFSLLKAHL